MMSETVNRNKDSHHNIAVAFPRNSLKIIYSNRVAASLNCHALSERMTKIHSLSVLVRISDGSEGRTLPGTIVRCAQSL
jgi:hypothetical protein